MAVGLILLDTDGACGMLSCERSDSMKYARIPIPDAMSPDRFRIEVLSSMSFRISWAFNDPISVEERQRIVKIYNSFRKMEIIDAPGTQVQVPEM